MALFHELLKSWSSLRHGFPFRIIQSWVDQVRIQMIRERDPDMTVCCEYRLSNPDPFYSFFKNFKLTTYFGAAYQFLNTLCILSLSVVCLS